MAQVLPVVDPEVGLATAGLAGGLVFAVWLRSGISLVLYRVDPADPWVLMAVFAFLGLATLAAAAIPALRAGCVDPVEAIRR